MKGFAILGLAILLAGCAATPLVKDANTSDSFNENLSGILDEFPLKSFSPGVAESWKMIENQITNGDIRRKWKNKRGQEIEVIARRAAHRTIDTIYSALGSELDTTVGSASGRVLVNEKYFGIATTNAGNGYVRFHVLAGTPNAAYWWKYKLRSTNRADLKYFSGKLIHLIREIQYQQAKARGNVVMGGWAGPIQAYANLLVKKNSPQAERVYRELLQVDSSNIGAHAEYMSIATNRQAAMQSARIVRKLAEGPKLIEASAKFLGEKVASIDSYPVVDQRNSTFHVTLIPLPPYNPWLLREVADTYESITGIPVHIRKLLNPWQLPPPTRTRYRPVLERLASQLWPNISDFSDWPLSRLQAQILEKAKEDTPASVAKVNALFEKVKNEGGQWDVDPLVESLWEAIKPFAAHSPYTIYVGLTGTDIYAKDTSFVFSSYGGYPKAPISVLSYARMTADITHEQQSRKRLVERIAKELVPASLKRLSIPRSLDPSCPYSYANGLQRVDEKSLTLSEPVKTRIREIKMKTGAGV